MTGTWKWYGKGLEHLLRGLLDFDNDTFYVMLTTSTYVPDQDVHDFRDDVTNEVVGAGYTAGGVALTGVSVSYDAGTNEARLTWTDPSWASATITARTAVIYKSRGGAASADELVAYCTESADVSSTNATFTVDLTTTVLKLTAAA